MFRFNAYLVRTSGQGALVNSMNRVHTLGYIYPGIKTRYDCHTWVNTRVYTRRYQGRVHTHKKKTRLKRQHISPYHQGVSHVARLIPAAYARALVVVSECLSGFVEVLLGCHQPSHRAPHEIALEGGEGRTGKIMLYKVLPQYQQAHNGVKTFL